MEEWRTENSDMNDGEDDVEITQTELAEYERYISCCDRLNDERMRQQIRESNQELRELEMKIRAAYVGKAIKLQLAEQETARLRDQLRMQKEQQMIEEKRMREETMDKQAKLEMKNRQIVLRGELQDQIMNKRLENKRLYEEFLKEKKIIDEIIRRIQEEKME